MTQDPAFSGGVSWPHGTDARPVSNIAEYSVSELSRALKRSVEDRFGHVRVRGEISQPKWHGSGHLYLRLKDESAVLEAVCWRGTAGRLSLRPEEGMEVVATGKLTTYMGRSQYQLVIETLELAGEGALLKLLEERKRRLLAEGLFDAGRKKKLPFLPDVIGVVTSPTGAVIRDILHRLADRFPRRVLLWPVAVQGDQAAAQVVAAIEGFNHLSPAGPVPRPDLIIVARGGGSLEDLMAFNEESVVRAAAASAIPLISAVGHETDTTLIDLAADLRAPTPTAAAEMAVPVRAELMALLLDDERRLFGSASRLIAERRGQVEGLARGLGDPWSLIESCLQRLDDRSERLVLAVGGAVERRRHSLSGLAARLRHPREQLADAAARLRSEDRALGAALRQVVLAERGRLARLVDRLSILAIRRRADDGRQAVGDLAARLDRAQRRTLQEQDKRLQAAGQLLESYSYRGVLERGFVLVTDPQQRPVSTVDAAKPGLAVTLEFADGRASAVIDGAASSLAAEPPKARPRAATKPKIPSKQASLF